MNSRRGFLWKFLAGAGALASGKTLAAADARAAADGPQGKAAHGGPARHLAREHGEASPLLVETPDVPSLPFRMEGGVKEFHLIAEPVKRQIVPFKMMEVWGYNGSCPGPTIQANQGDRVRIIFENHLPESTTLHWHGLEVPIEMDGLPYVTQQPVQPGGRFVYEFTLHQEGTYFYHSHGAMQEMMGMIGMFILHPEKPYEPRVDHDYGIILQEWAILPDSNVPNTANMEFNWLTFNGVAAPATTPLLARLGSRVRIRLVNLGMDHHPMHLHGNQFMVTGTEAGRSPESSWRRENTVLVGVAQARDIEFEAKYPGDWMLHCHLPHHMMNSMSDLLLNGAVVEDRSVMTAATNDAQALSQMQTLANSIPFEHVHHAPIAENANSVAGFPQDAFMDMGMDEAVAKPETYGLAENWSANMMGMMTLVRVLPSEKFDEIMEMKRQGVKSKPAAPAHHHEAHEHQE
jgi:FtsP/CotA-like multicopper oxidase with cupredoxin domain